MLVRFDCLFEAILKKSKIFTSLNKNVTWAEKKF